MDESVQKPTGASESISKKQATQSITMWQQTPRGML
jgi:hypothetical protein